MSVRHRYSRLEDPLEPTVYLLFLSFFLLLSRQCYASHVAAVLSRNGRSYSPDATCMISWDLPSLQPLSRIARTTAGTYLSYVTGARVGPQPKRVMARAASFVCLLRALEVTTGPEGAEL
ncbi:hypothetical protein GGR56DRAFT_646630, partial [Xylariaceae sp. FL0804]